MNDLDVKDQIRKENSLILEDNKNSEVWVKCEFCGFEYKKCDGVSCECCPINCNIIKCPNCGYEVLPESKSYKFIEDNYKKIKNKLFK